MHSIHCSSENRLKFLISKTYFSVYHGFQQFFKVQDFFWKVADANKKNNFSNWEIYMYGTKVPDITW